MKQAPPVAAVLLAAGRSSRFAGSNKLLHDWNGKPLVRHVAETLTRAGVGRVLVATGHEAEVIHAALEGLGLFFVHNPAFRDGMGSTIAASAEALHPEEAALIVPADMPWIQESTLRQIMELGSCDAIVVPHHGDRAGNPVLFPPDLKLELLKLTGDHGARAVVEAHLDRIVRLGVNEQELEDVDFRGDFGRSS
ncbi:MAG: nucleotidyltransferase family protein [Armatimonadetes bacterium]|nr:nucleotidyltransferase family protein [Armatimonadota bacterium]